MPTYINTGNWVKGIKGFKNWLNLDLFVKKIILQNLMVVPDATTTVKGILKLANDLGGTADNPTTPTAVHVTGDEDILGQKTFYNNGIGISIYSENTSTGIGINTSNTSTGTSILARNYFTGDNIVADSGDAATGFNYVGKSNDTNTFTVDKFGSVIGNSFETIWSNGFMQLGTDYNYANIKRFMFETYGNGVEFSTDNAAMFQMDPINYINIQASTQGKNVEFIVRPELVYFKVSLNIINTINIPNEISVLPEETAFSKKIIAPSFQTPTGLSTQFLMADGSVSTSANPVSDSQSGIVNNESLQELGGVDKLINGVRIGRGRGNTDLNIGIGTFVFDSSNTGAQNIGIGQSSLGATTTGNSNIAIGLTALFENSTGNNNVAIGVGAGADGITTGSNNTYIGQGTNIGNTSNTIILAAGTTNRIIVDSTGKTNLLARLNVSNVPTYANNEAAITGGLIVGDIYRTASGVVMIRF